MAASGADRPWPTGTLALVFTDVERSTELWQIDEDAFEWALAEHDQEVRDTLVKHAGFEVKHTGDGFFLVFQEVANAALFCLDLQDRLREHPWPSELGDVKTRVGLHVGRARLAGSDYRGPAVNLCSRVCGASSGGQTLISGEAAAALWRLPGMGALTRRVGSFHLPGIPDPVEIHELARPESGGFDIRPLAPDEAPLAAAAGAEYPPETPPALRAALEEPGGRFSEADAEAWNRVKIALRQADNPSAIAELVVLAEHRPHDVKVLTTLGVAYAVEQAYDRAEECLARAVELDQAHASAWFNLARVYGKQGRREKIEHALTMALRADPQHPKARAVAVKYGIHLTED
ncbi:MAG: hypothetical protein IT204_16070 [Fimbriimonadaceae bacterium]|nr:hypothetical protein [Fimbriimonadaceae bacterium]